MVITSDKVVSEFNYIMINHVNDPRLSYIKIDLFIKYLCVNEDKSIDGLILYYFVLLWYNGPLFSYLKKRKPVMIEYSSRAEIRNGCKISEFALCFKHLQKELKIKSYASKHYILIVDHGGRLTKMDLNKISANNMGLVVKDYVCGNI